MSASGWPPLPPEEKLRCHLEAAHLREFVAIEPDSGEYFLGKTLIEAIQASRAAPIRSHLACGSVIPQRSISES
jgi:hypothetical protein